jgi:hypothetical protein
MPRPLLLLMFTLGLSASLKATTTFYALAFDQTTTPFGTINPTTGAFTQIGSSFPDAADDIAVSPAGVVYAVLDSGSLITINTTTAAISVIGTLPTGVQSLAFRPDGTLFGATTTSLYTLNPSTAAGTLLGSMGLGGSDADNIRFDGSTLFVMTVDTNSRLYSLSQTSGAGTLIGPSGIDDVSLGAFFGGVFYGSNTAGAQNHIAQINPATGVGTEGANTSTEYLFALAPATVPEPATFLICCAGLVFLAGKRIVRPTL